MNERQNSREQLLALVQALSSEIWSSIGQNENSRLTHVYMDNTEEITPHLITRGDQLMKVAGECKELYQALKKPENMETAALNEKYNHLKSQLSEINKNYSEAVNKIKNENDAKTREKISETPRFIEEKKFFFSQARPAPDEEIKYLLLNLYDRYQALNNFCDDKSKRGSDKHNIAIQSLNYFADKYEDKYHELLGKHTFNKNDMKELKVIDEYLGDVHQQCGIEQKPLVSQEDTAHRFHR
jgi:DNA repair ATPase RecN